jgi:hypothetical protein
VRSRNIFAFAQPNHERCGASSLASDEDYTLFTVVIFRKVYDTFAQKCRENKYEFSAAYIRSLFVLLTVPSERYIMRDFQYSADQIEKEREELQMADTAEKELWVSFPHLTIAAKSHVLTHNHRRSSSGFRKSTFQRLSKFLFTSR